MRGDTAALLLGGLRLRAGLTFGFVAVTLRRLSGLFGRLLHALAWLRSWAAADWATGGAAATEDRKSVV